MSKTVVTATVEGNVLVLLIPLSQFQVAVSASADGGQNFELGTMAALPNGFDVTWPRVGVLHYDSAVKGKATWQGRSYDIRIGQTIRPSAGRDRVYVLVEINKYPTLNFIEGDDGRYASIITPAGERSTVRPGQDLPKGYAEAELSFAEYHDVVCGPHARHGRAVVVNSPTEFGPMVRHAILRWEGRQSS